MPARTKVFWVLSLRYPGTAHFPIPEESVCSVWFSKTCLAYQEKKIKSLRKTVFTEWIVLLNTFSFFQLIQIAKTPNTNPKATKGKLVFLSLGATQLFHSFAVTLSLALFQICVSFPLAYLLFLAQCLSFGFVSHIYPRLSPQHFLKALLELCPN